VVRLRHFLTFETGPLDHDLVIVGRPRLVTTLTAADGARATLTARLMDVSPTGAAALERREISCGTTWHAAGLVGQLRATENLTRLAKYGGDLYERLEAETGQATGFRTRRSCAIAPSRWWARSTRCTGRSCSRGRRAACATRCSTTGSPRAARASGS
jgi:hypothetical protein